MRASRPSQSRFALSLLFVFLLGSVLVGCSPSVSSPVEEARPLTVRTSPVSLLEQSAEPLRFAGIVQARRRATLTFQVSGKLSERPAQLGATVDAGQVLARLFNPGLEPGLASASARLDELQARHRQAWREWKRSRQLNEKGVVSEQELEQLRAQRDSLRASVATAKARLAESEQMVAESVLIAPFAGRVAAIFTEVDEYVAAGEPVMRLSAPGDYEVEVRVPTYLLNQVSVGQSVPVWQVQDRTLPPVAGEIVEIAQPGAARGELQQVLVRLPHASLEAGVPVEVGITPRTASAMTVPMLSVVRSSTGTSVFRVTDAQAERISVQVHRIIGERAVVTSEKLQPEDQVVYAGMTRITDGDRLELLP